MSLGMLEHQHVCIITVHQSKQLHLSLLSFFFKDKSDFLMFFRAGIKEHKTYTYTYTVISGL